MSPASRKLRCRWRKCRSPGPYVGHKELYEHLVVHSHRDQGSFQCKWKGCVRNVVKDSRNSARHLMVHTSYRPHSCVYCGRTFRRTAGVRDHCKRRHAAAYEADLKLEDASSEDDPDTVSDTEAGPSPLQQDSQRPYRRGRDNSGDCEVQDSRNVLIKSERDESWAPEARQKTSVAVTNHGARSRRRLVVDDSSDEESPLAQEKNQSGPPTPAGDVDDAGPDHESRLSAAEDRIIELEARQSRMEELLRKVGGYLAL
ncbi:hypothetical protein AURDEDRAFT_166314 [Auricularia subglabra TFB-10046 SS5]|uniref:C2H2-type domain-containing protein n=1 Tax=Auricularia subglabra (strain TFB-10046 / SS5) TaxID=717982 RepID=J0WXK7_AURST|nr:hypothetical protein AURDEDRAFT_166314 [Auricularia subglabra TFB-10046 SS5]